VGRNLLLLTYCFPPANIVGAVRPYQMARFFQKQGWNVDVISIIDESIVDSDKADISGISSIRLKAPGFVSWLNTVKSHGGWLGKLKTLMLRGLKYVIRASIFPEHFIVLRKAYVNEAMRLASGKRFDLLISSALPFTIHCAARQVAGNLGLPWVADNRDLWAASPYRKTFPLWRLFDHRHERSILAKADLVLGISQGMVTYYREQCGFEHALLVMNGYSPQPTAETTGDRPANRGLEIVYGGILYNGVRDPSPLLQAIDSDPQLKSVASVRFYGSEPDRVAALAETFRDCSVECHPRVSKAEISSKYQGASLLLVILGSSDFENGVMTGKFFEYLAHGKPILAIASEESELARVINDYGLGLASRNPERIAAYLRSYLAGDVPRSIELPKELSIDFQLSILYRAIESLPAFSSRPLAT
jgi:glycosyltransferase involved in cell wall biosynthesis